MRRLLSKAGHLHASAVAAASQAAGLAQILLLTRDSGTGIASDAYFFLFTLSQLPIQIVLIGVAYPIILNTAGHGSPALRHIRVATPALCVLAVGIGAGWLELHHRLPSSLLALVVVCAVNGALSSVIWFTAIDAAAGGNALWLAGAALPANVGACIAIAYPWQPPAARSAAMVVGLIVGNIALYAFIRRSHSSPLHEHRPNPRVSQEDSSAPWSSGSNVWYLAKSALAYGGQNVLQALAVLLPASSVTILNIVARLTSAVPTTVVNALLPRFINTQSETPESAVRFAQMLTVAGGLVYVGAVPLAILHIVPYGPYVIIIFGWLIAANLNSVAHRVAYRFLAPGSSVWSVITTLVVLVFLVFASGQPWFSLPLLLVSAMALDAIPGACLWWTLDRRPLSAVSVGSLACSAALVLSHAA